MRVYWHDEGQKIGHHDEGNDNDKIIKERVNSIQFWKLKKDIILNNKKSYFKEVEVNPNPSTIPPRSNKKAKQTITNNLHSIFDNKPEMPIFFSKKLIRPYNSP